MSLNKTGRPFTFVPKTYLFMIDWIVNGEHVNLRGILWWTYDLSLGYELWTYKLLLKKDMISFLISKHMTSACFWDDFPIAAGPDFGRAQLRRCRGWGISGSLPSSTTRLTSRNLSFFSLYPLPFILFPNTPVTRSLPALRNNATRCFYYLQPCSCMCRDNRWCWIGYSCSLGQCFQDK